WSAPCAGRRGCSPCWSARPTRARLLAFELAARPVAGLFWAAALRLPLVGDLVRPWLKRRTACAFLGFEDAAETRVGCLLHPSRWSGADVRPDVAFGWLPGFGCGAPDWYCEAAHRFAAAGWQELRDFARTTDGMSWYRYGRTAGAYSPSSGRRSAPA